MFVNSTTYCFAYPGIWLLLQFGDNFYYYYHRRCHGINHRAYNNFDSDFFFFFFWSKSPSGPGPPHSRGF